MGLWAKLWPFAKTESPTTPAVLQTLRSAHAALDRAGVAHAVIGGMTLAALGIPRATKDVDFLIDAADGERASAVMRTLGYTSLEENETFRCFVLDMYARVDFLLARSERTRAMLNNASAVQFEGTPIRVLRPEDFIGLKLQAFKNRGDRNVQDLADIDRVVEHYGSRLDLDVIRSYCELLELPHELERIAKGIAAAAR